MFRLNDRIETLDAQIETGLGHALTRLDQLPRWLLGLISVALVALVGLIDALTGEQVAFALFYLAPIALMAWYVGRRPGAWLSAACAIIWLLADLAVTAQPYARLLIPIWNTYSRFGFFLIVTVLLSALRRSLDREKTLARLDYLTGAANARAFFDVATLELSRARRYRHALTIAYIDVDNFKEVNDQYGHAAGDGVLRMTVATIRRNLRASDLVARLGGDEFALLLPETGPAAAEAVGQKMQAHLLQAAREQNWPVTFSIGVLTCVQLPQTIEEALHAADELMYSVKKTRKNMIRYATLNEIELAR
jgi:diguanylate cyclase (GGDEF)-like protein